ncbi:MAG: hypothetical protein R3B54_10935 [Bdellovibrionota bacterium]
MPTPRIAPKCRVNRSPSTAKRPVRALYIGGIGPNNALEQAVRFLPKFPELELCLVGWAEEADKSSLQQLARSVGASERLRFLEL